MIDWNYLFKIGIALFAIVNAIGGVPVFISATEGWSAPARAHAARTIALTVFTVLTLAVFIGDRMLAFFGISIASFQVGGGILLLLMAISMMHAKQSGARQTAEEALAASDREAVAIVPLSIPLLAGPGAISSMIIAADQSGSLWGHVLLIGPVTVVSLLVWMILMLSVSIAHRLGTIGINIVTRLMGLILAAMAVEFMAHGLGSLFPGLLT
jgi:multiple antibiotic resistance protein